MIDLSVIRKADPELCAAMEAELKRQRGNIELIASENIVSPAVLAAAGSHLTNKYAEGLPGKRYYGGCQYVDVAENLARERLKALFGCEHCNVQSHSGAQANFAVYFGMLEPGDTIMGMNLSHGGHLTHGSPVNISGKYFKVVPYGVSPETERIDYDEMERIALECRPKMIVTGASAYPRVIDFKRIREICDKVGAYMMADIAHIAGLVAAGLHPSPVPYADFVTTTTHKTLRGPRGGVIMCREKYAKQIDKAVFPGTQGGPLMHIIAAKAVAFGEALKPEFADYQRQIVANAAAMAGNDHGRRVAVHHRGGDGGGVYPSGGAAGLGRDGQSPHARRPARHGGDGQGARIYARRSAYHRQQEHRSLRDGIPLRHERHPRRHPGGHHPRHEGRGVPDDRLPHRPRHPGRGEVL